MKIKTFLHVTPWLLAFAVLAILASCSADYDTFGTSSYCKLNGINVVEQKYEPAVYSGAHRIEFDLVEVPDSMETWDSVTVEDIDMSHFASMHLVKSKFAEFPTDSTGLDSLANDVAYDDNPIEEGDKIRIPSSHIVYVVIISENGKKSIWQLKFNIPNVEPAESSTSKSSSSAKSSSSGKSSSSAKSSSSSAKASSSNSEGSSGDSDGGDSEDGDDESSSSVGGNSSDAPAPQVLSLSIAGVDAIIDDDEKSIHVDDLEFRSDLTALELSAMELSEGATADVNVGDSYDFGAGLQLTVTNEDGVSATYMVKAGYQLPGENFDSWNSNDVKPDTVWGNANTILTTTQKTTSGTMIGAEIKTGSALGKIASGSLYTADFNPKGVGTLSMASSSTWPDGNELLDFGKPFAARPEYMEVKFSYTGKGDSCDIYILLENRTGDKNVNRKASDENKLVASAWYRSTTEDNSGRENPDVVSVSDADENGMRTLRLKLHYGTPLEGSAIENSSTFNTELKSSNSNAINNGLVQGDGSEPVTHIRVVFASSADGNHYNGTSGATLIVDDLKLIY